MCWIYTITLQNNVRNNVVHGLVFQLQTAAGLLVLY